MVLGVGLVFGEDIVWRGVLAVTDIFVKVFYLLDEKELVFLGQLVKIEVF